MMALGLIDAAVVGGVDCLCLTTLYGFNSLELLSAEICRPYDAHRNGLSIGEAAAFALLERDAECAASAGCSAVGETSDGHHMSARTPKALARPEAMRRRLPKPGLTPATWTTSTCTAPQRRTTTAAEDLAIARCSVRDDALQLDQGRDRPHARRGRCGGSRGRDAGLEHSSAGRPESPATRPALHCTLPMMDHTRRRR